MSKASEEKVIQFQRFVSWIFFLPMYKFVCSYYYDAWLFLVDATKEIIEWD